MSQKPKKAPQNAASPRLATLRMWGPVCVGACLGFAVIGGLAVLPARTWVTQRTAMGQGEAQLQQVDGRIAELEAQLRLLQTDSEVERMARENFDLVFPGEESYRILPAPEQN